ncbi:hypothetical protein, partial [Neokomagataea anthophila]
ELIGIEHDGWPRFRGFLGLMETIHAADHSASQALGYECLHRAGAAPGQLSQVAHLNWLFRLTQCFQHRLLLGTEFWRWRNELI